MNALPKDILEFIGKLLWKEYVNDMHLELKRTFKVGISTLYVRNGRVSRRKIFVYDDFSMNSYASTSQFYEIAKKIEFIEELKGWERQPFNYRNLNVKDENALSPGFMCIKNGEENIAVLPRRYIYSNPMNIKTHNKYKKYIKHYCDNFKFTKSIRPGSI